jgi:hypothetical protein
MNELEHIAHSIETSWGCDELDGGDDDEDADNEAIELDVKILNLNRRASVRSSFIHA